MKDKEKQIEEMAKDIGIAFQLAGTTSFVKVAEILVEKYQPKLSEDSVVLTKEEYEILTKDIEHPTDEVLKKLVVGKNILTEQVIEKASKETAEKILKWFRKHFYGTGWCVVETYFKEQFGVEIKE